MTTLQEHFWMFQTSLGGVPMLDRSDFCNNTFVNVFDPRRFIGDASSGIRREAAISLKNLTPDNATEVHLTLWAHSICHIKASAIQILD